MRHFERSRPISQSAFWGLRPRIGEVAEVMAQSFVQAGFAGDEALVELSSSVRPGGLMDLARELISGSVALPAS